MKLNNIKRTFLAGAAPALNNQHERSRQICEFQARRLAAECQ